jgi:hypothetical protein
MSVVHPTFSWESIVDTMIQLASAGRSHRVITAGSAAVDIYCGLCRRGFERVTTAAHRRVPGTQYDVALIAGQESVRGLEALLIRIMPLLNCHAIVAVWVDAMERRRGSTVQLLLERLGFHVESGAKCETGFILAARRQQRNDLANVA